MASSGCSRPSGADCRKRAGSCVREKSQGASRASCRQVPGARKSSRKSSSDKGEVNCHRFVKEVSCRKRSDLCRWMDIDPPHCEGPSPLCGAQKTRSACGRRKGCKWEGGCESKVQPFKLMELANKFAARPKKSPGNISWGARKLRAREPIDLSYDDDEDHDIVRVSSARPSKEIPPAAPRSVGPIEVISDEEAPSGSASSRSASSKSAKQPRDAPLRELLSKQLPGRTTDNSAMGACELFVDNYLTVPSKSVVASFLVHRVPGDGNCFWAALCKNAELILGGEEARAKNISVATLRKEVAGLIEAEADRHREHLGKLLDATGLTAAETHLVNDVAHNTAPGPATDTLIEFLVSDPRTRQDTYNSTTLKGLIRRIRSMHKPYWAGEVVSRVAAHVLSTLMGQAMCIVILKFSPANAETRTPAQFWASRYSAGDDCDKCIFLLHTGEGGFAHYDVLQPVPGSPLFPKRR